MEIQSDILEKNILQKQQKCLINIIFLFMQILQIGVIEYNMSKSVRHPTSEGENVR